MTNYLLQKKQICILFLLSFISIQTFALTNIAGGNVSGAWTLANSPYMIQGNIQVPIGSILTIEPGVKVLFQGHFQLKVLGALQAIGTATDSIYFTVADTTGFADRTSVVGSWKGIFFNDADVDSSYIKYANISHYKDTSNVSFQYPLPAAISCYLTDKVQVSNSYIHDCHSGRWGNAINVEICNPYFHHLLIADCWVDTANIQPYSVVHYNNATNCTFEYNEIKNCWGGRVLYFVSCTKTEVQYNYFHHNMSFWGGGAVAVVGQGDIWIAHNIISYNKGNEAGGGLMIQGQGLTAHVIANMIANNETVSATPWVCGVGDGGGGVYVQYATLYMQNNMIVNNICYGNGGAIQVADVFVNMINNTICNNQAGGGGTGNGGALYFYATPNNMSISTYPHKVSNNIIYGNRDSYWTFNLDDQLYFLGGYYNTEGKFNQIEGFNPAIVAYPNFAANDSINPLFIAPTIGIGNTFNGTVANWGLQMNSPCINTGNPDTTGYKLEMSDYSGAIRIQNDTIEKGALEYRKEITAIDKGLVSTIKIFPNPSKGFFQIEVPSNFIGQTLSIFDMQAKKILETAIQFDKFILQIDAIDAGIYFLKIGTETRKIVRE